ncbi:peptide deformylase [Staphylococcus lugdunensis]|uniref:peptide deformylase n=1 Tax=Staphylococcus lugdunensis TaxID=28035 RepID=UPI0020947AC1|nr:peptide deformylase [Staphylococcus lugdunensis]MCO7041623.1 peptide deformylase [Staphylococcus lugdunensis]
MTVKPLIKSTHPLLKRKAQRVTEFDKPLTQLLLDIEDTLYQQEASALCASQIGIDKQVAIVDMEMEGLLQLINPTIIKASDEQVIDLEGSISLPGIYGEVARSQMIVVQSYDVQGNTLELTAYDDVARMMQRIIDQMNGIAFTNKAQKILTDKEVEAYFDNE